MKEMYEIGMFQTFFSPGTWQITLPLWMSVGVGFAAQYFVFEKVESYFKWLLAFISILVIVLFEGLSHILTGWDLFGLLIIYGGVFAAFMGIVAASMVYLIKKK